MDRLLNTMLGGMIPQAEPTPEWLTAQGCCPYLRGEELWWGIGSLLVRGAPPAGVNFSHSHFHKLAPNWGPIGEPVQVEPTMLTYRGTIALADQFGERRGTALVRYLDLLHDLARTSTIIMRYPDLAEGDPQWLAAFQSYDVPDYETDLGGMKRVNELFAFLAPISSNPMLYLTEEQRATLPLFSGTETPNDTTEEHLGY